MNNKNEITGIKVVKWFDRNSKEMIFGLDVQINGKNWYHLLEDEEPVFYKTEKEAMKRLKEVYKEENSKTPEIEGIKTEL